MPRKVAYKISFKVFKVFNDFKDFKDFKADRQKALHKPSPRQFERLPLEILKFHVNLSPVFQLPQYEENNVFILLRFIYPDDLRTTFYPFYFAGSPFSGRPNDVCK
jgi:hypothetical protein